MSEYYTARRAYVIAHTVKSRLPTEGDQYRFGWYDACLEIMKRIAEEYPEAAK